MPALAVAALLTGCGVGAYVSHGPEPADYMAAVPVGSYEDVAGWPNAATWEAWEAAVAVGGAEPERRREGR